MASVIRIKRSSVSGNPSTLAAGELAYSALTDNGSNGGDRLYIGIGTETSGNAANHFVIGGKYFTDLLDHTPGVLTATSALVVDSSKKLDELLVDNLSLNGNSVTSTNTNGDINITPNGAGKTVIGNAYIGDTSTSLAEYIYDTVGGAITQGTGITITNSDAGNTSTVAITNTTVTAGSYGSTTQIPTFTVNAQGQLTAAGTASVASTLNISGDTGADGIALLSETLGFVGGTGITSSVTANTVTFDIDSTVATLTDTQTLTNKTFVAPILGAATATSITATSGNLTLAAAAGNNSVSITPTGTGTVDVASKRITSVAEPTQPQDAATKNYVDTVAEGLHIHEAAHCATTGTLAVLSGGTVTYNNGTAGVGATLTLSVGLTAIDGHTLTNGDRILVKNEATQAHNGMYVRTSATVLTRSLDMDTALALAGGDFTFVENGTLYNSTGWVQTEEVLTVGTDNVIWQQFSGSGTFTAGNGLTLSGTEFNVGGTANRISVTADAVDIASTYVGQTSITTLGTIATGTWSATTIATTRGGTGITTYATGDLLYASASNTLSKLTAGADGTILQMNASGVPVWGDLDGGTY